MLWTALIGLLVTWLAVNVFRSWLSLPRPVPLDLGIQWLGHGARGSFPSLHASCSFALAMVVALDRRDGWAALFLLAAVSIAWSRVYLGLHFPSDVLAGAMVGSFVALTVLRAAPIGRRPHADSSIPGRVLH